MEKDFTQMQSVTQILLGGFGLKVSLSIQKELLPSYKVSERKKDDIAEILSNAGREIIEIINL